MSTSDILIRINVKNYGSILVELYPKLAPNSVANFMHYVKQNFYNGLIFHRIIKGFMIQGGGGKKTNQPIKGEFLQNGFNNPIKHERGVISFARTSDPNSATSQFFIMHQNAPHLDGAYAAFGKVVEGLETVDKIANVRTGFQDKPVDDVMIDHIDIIEINTPLMDPVFL
jgi:peptidyl-prolyl cis-trans isomerase B (cyclophilin B)